MRFNAKVVFVFVAVISVEWVHANPRGSKCQDCEENSGGDQTGAIIIQHDVSFEGGDNTGINFTQRNAIFEGGSGHYVGANLNQSDVHFRGGQGKKTGINAIQDNVTFGGSTECKSSHCRERNDDSASGKSNGFDGSDRRHGTHGSHGFDENTGNGRSGSSGSNTSGGSTHIHVVECGNDDAESWEETDTNDGSNGDDHHSSVTGKPPRIQQIPCADRPMTFCGIFDGVPVHARDCTKPFQRCPPSNTGPTGSRTPQFPNGGHGSTRQPNGNGAPAHGQRPNGGYTHGSENGWESTDTNDGSSSEERHPSATGKPPRAQPSCADRPMVICKYWEGVPVYARDCNNPFERCPPSNTRPTQVPNGGHGPTRHPNGNDAPTPGQGANGDYTQGSQSEWESTHHQETHTHHGNQQHDCQSSDNNCQHRPPQQGNGNGNTHHVDEQHNCQSSDNNCQQQNRPKPNPYDVDYDYPTYPGPFFGSNFPFQQSRRVRPSSRQQVSIDGENLMASNGPDQFVFITDDGIITSNN